MKSTFVIALLIGAFFSGCGTLVLTPHDSALERKLDEWSEGGGEDDNHHHRKTEEEPVAAQMQVIPQVTKEDFKDASNELKKALDEKFQSVKDDLKSMKEEQKETKKDLDSFKAEMKKPPIAPIPLPPNVIPQQNTAPPSPELGNPAPAPPPEEYRNPTFQQEGQDQPDIDMEMKSAFAKYLPTPNFTGCLVLRQQKCIGCVAFDRRLMTWGKKAGWTPEHFQSVFLAKNPAEWRKLGIYRTPTFVFFRNGEEYGRHVGFQDTIDDFNSIVSEHPSVNNNQRFQVGDDSPDSSQSSGNEQQYSSNCSAPRYYNPPPMMYSGSNCSGGYFPQSYPVQQSAPIYSGYSGGYYGGGGGSYCPSCAPSF